MNAKVYVVQSPMRRDAAGELVQSYDLTPAREYGDIEILLPSGPVLLSTSNAVRTLRTKLRDFGDQDYLLCLGDPVAIGAASAIASQVNNGVVHMLVWDRHVRKYLAITLDIYNRLEAAA